MSEGLHGPGRSPRGIGREELETFLAALGFFLAALVWFWISLSRG